LPEAAQNPFSALTGAPPPPPPAPAAVPAKPAPLAQSTPEMSEPERRYKSDFDRLTKADPYRDPSQLLRRAPDGTITGEPRSPDPAAQPGAPPGPAGVENGRLRIGEIELSEQDVRGLLERKGIEDSRRATMPASADGYTLPTDMQMPPGVQFQWAVDNEVLGPALGRPSRSRLMRGFPRTSSESLWPFTHRPRSMSSSSSRALRRRKSPSSVSSRMYAWTA